MYIADLHCDTLYKIRQDRKQGIKSRMADGDFHVNLQKLKQSGYLLQNFAAFVDAEEDTERFSACNELIDIFYEEIENNKESIIAVKSFADIEECIKSNRLGALLTVEEGGVTEGCIDKLEKLYGRGVRMMTLTWNYENELAYPNDVEKQQTELKNGLKKQGFEVAEAMKELGMLIDISHLSDAGAFELLKDLKLTILASHSNARAVCNHVRNLPDELIRLIADRGGIIGINLSTNFIGGSGGREDIIKHIRHMINVGGSECVALGTDFDGIETNPDIPGAESIGVLAKTMTKAGISHTQQEKIFYKNALRFYKEMLKGF